MAGEVVQLDGNKITLGKATIRVTGQGKDYIAAVLSKMITNRLGSVFCPVCGSPAIHWRSGVHFENEKRCAACDHCWEPESETSE
jgi:competence CoiA-like predicted nuclease